MEDLRSSVYPKWSASDISACEVCGGRGLCKSALYLCRPCLTTYCPNPPQYGMGIYNPKQECCGICSSPNSPQVLFNSVWVVFCIKCFQKTNLEETAKISSQVLYLGHLDPSPLSKEFKGDVLLIVDDNEIQAHRYVISLKSPVFKTMMEVDMKEKSTGRIYIKDVSAAVVRAAINFMYTATIKFNEEVNPREVIKFAHRYEMSWLKDICETALVETISCKNIIELLSISYALDAKVLKKEVMAFFSKQSASEHRNVVDGIFDKLVGKSFA